MSDKTKLHADRLAHKIVRDAQRSHPHSVRSASLYSLDEMTASGDITPEMSKYVENALEKHLSRAESSAAAAAVIA